VRLSSLGYFGHMWELYAYWAWIYPFFLGQTGLSISSAEAATFAFLSIGVGAAGCYVGGVLGDNWGRTKLAALAMLLSGSCCLTVGLVSRLGLVPLLCLTLFWGFWVIADSGQFSSMVTEVADPGYVGTALTLQLASGFVLTVVTIWLIPVVQRTIGWDWAFVVLAPGPLLGIWAMLRLKGSPEAAAIAGGRG
jgi:MFS family permease